ncbi:MAG: AbrB/MazE/SpoVT family DNA-binding domain-containing protein, partial [Rhodospirillales bacterium]
MQAQLARWGNSLGVRIPKDIARRTGLTAGTQVEIETENNRIVITPVQQA